MMKLKKELLSKAKMHLTDDAYKSIETFLKLDAIISLRVFLSDLAEECEIRHMIEDSRTDEWLAIDEMNNIAIELAIQKNDGVDDGIVKSRRKRISTGS
jgi:hypothetical protein